MSDGVLAVFDLDGTLTIRRSLESAFIQFLLRTGRVGCQGLFLAAQFYLMHVWRDPVTAAKRNKLYLKGTARVDGERWATAFLKENGEGFLSRQSQELVRHHSRLGHTTILVTGSLEMLVNPLLSSLELPFDRVYSTHLEVVDGRFTGQIAGTHYYGEEKANLVAMLAAEWGADLARSFCYADSKSDLAMMGRFGHPVAVNPDKTLRRKAFTSDWEIIDLL